MWSFETYSRPASWGSGSLMIFSSLASIRLAVDEDPALLADEPVAVLTVAGGDQPGAVGVGVGDGEVWDGSCSCSACPTASPPTAVTATGPVSSMPEAPLGDVVVVRAPVGHLAAGVLVPPAELVMAALLDVGHVGGRALPEVPVELLRGPARRGRGRRPGCRRSAPRRCGPCRSGRCGPARRPGETAASERCWLPVWKIRSYFRAALTIAWPSAMVSVSGFSQ